MTWTEKMKQKTAFVEAKETGLFTMSELCERYGISRPTGYLWWNRYQEEGYEGLEERSRAPRTCSHAMSEETKRLILEMRTKERWGARKLRDWLRNQRPGVKPPAVSTLQNFLEQNGLVKKRRRRGKWKHPGADAIHTEAPNDVWTTDFKGQFPTQDGVDCYPLTIVDQHTRYILAVKALPDVKQAGVFPVFERLFREHGLPKAIRSDNGVPFCTRAIHGLSALSIWWMKLAIQHSRMDRGKPQQNGAHERMHKTLKEDTALPPRKNMRAQQRRFDEWRARFNNERPHEFLDGATPSSRWSPSPRPYPSKLRKPEYPGHFVKRLVSNAGTFRLHNIQTFISQLLKQEYIGLEEVDDGLWDVYFYETILARFDERKGKLIT